MQERPHGQQHQEQDEAGDAGTVRVPDSAALGDVLQRLAALQKTAP